MLVLELCLREPDGPGCEALRRAGWLPPPPPSLSSLDGCWSIYSPRAEVSNNWICLGERDVTTMIAGWDVVPHGGWHRDDDRRYAGWSATLVDGRMLWLTVLPTQQRGPTATRSGRSRTWLPPAPGEPIPPAFALHLTDGGTLSVFLGARARTLAPGIEAQRAGLPTIVEVCAAARACLDALPRPPAAPGELAVEPTPMSDEIGTANTLRGCWYAWQRVAARVVESRVPVPSRCGTKPPANVWWSSELYPPFAPL